MSVGEYVTRVRMRAFIEELKMPAASARRAAEAAGFVKYHNVVEVLRRRTGLTPSELRSLVHDDIRAVLNEELTIRRAESRQVTRYTRGTEDERS